jgi:hypothetical protein
MDGYSIDFDKDFTNSSKRKLNEFQEFKQTSEHKFKFLC